MKKLFALLVACMMLLSMAPAMAESAYTPVNLADSASIIPVYHTLELIDGATELPCTITYTFTVGDLEVVAPTGIPAAQYANMVEGAPEIDGFLFYSAADFTGNLTSTKELAIDWSGVTVKEPGVYRWEVTKSMTHTATDTYPSNNNDTGYLFVTVTDVNGQLQVSSANLSTNAALSEKDGYDDTYPAQQLNLKVAKQVTGNQGSRTQYFKFTVLLKLPAGTKMDDVGITGISANVPATPYNTAQTNQLTFAPVATGDYNYQATIWLRHGDTATITGLPYGASYSVIEDDATAAGYTVTTGIVGDQEGAVEGDYDVTDGKLTGSTTVTFTNDKTAEVPTGIDLQTGAPIMGLLLAACLMMLISKRKFAAE